MSKYIKTRWESLATGVSGDIELERAWLRKAKEVYDIFCKKQKSYGPDNIATTRERGVVIRMYDKMQRLLNISVVGTEDPLEDETLRDTVVDIADYGIIWLLCYDGDWPEYVEKEYSNLGVTNITGNVATGETTRWWNEFGCAVWYILGIIIGVIGVSFGPELFVYLLGKLTEEVPLWR